MGLNGELDHTLLTGAFETITGYTPEEYKVIGGWRSIVHPDDRERDTVNMETLLRNQSSVAEIRIVNKSSETRWVRVYAHPVWDDAANRLIEINGAVQDITARRRAEDALRESETRLRALLDATTDVAFLITRTGTFLTLNKAFADTLGKSVEELVGENCFELMPPDLKERRISYFEAAAESQEAMRWQDETSGGWWDNSVYPMISADGPVEAFAVYSRDITEQRRLAAELKLYTDQLQQMVEERTAQLRRAKDQIELILNHTKDAVALADTNGHIRTRNPAFVALFGERVSESLDQILWAVKGNDQGASVGAALMNALSGQSQPRLSTQITAQDGEERDLDLAFIPVLLADETERLGVLVSAHDITHLKEIERFKARFITDAFHDLATPITALTTRLYLLKNKPERLDEHVRALENQVDHLHDLLVDLRTLAQFDRGQIVLNLQPANLNQIVARVFDTYESIAISKKQNLTLTVDVSLPDTRLDHRQIERVLINLISNAIHYTPEDKKIELKTVYKDDYIIFEVADEGIGIAAEDLTHVFERFYRSQLARETRTGGTGLGLAIVKEIVELHGGTVSATSELEHGSTFIMRLPVQS
ncbi:MAG: PAS domain S-box protein [Anaerolineae bacterium]